jgi:opacity protein-like surface antigen
MKQDNNIMKNVTLVSTLAASLVAFSAHADVDNLYLEGALGQVEIENGSESTSDTSIGLLGGYQVFSNGALSLGTELGYNQYLSKETETPFGNATSTISSLSLGGKVAYEVVPKVQVFGRIAYESMKQEVEFLGVNASDTSDEFTYAIGASYAVAKQFTVGTQYKYAQLDSKTDLSNVNVSVGYQF